MNSKLYFVLNSLFLSLTLVSCTSLLVGSPDKVQTKTTPNYDQQMENLQGGIYFRASGDEAQWGLTISEKTIEFTAKKSGFEKWSGAHVEPIPAMDANVKTYHVITDLGTINFQIFHQQCSTGKSSNKAAYQVKGDITNTKTGISFPFEGCGNYITDSRLHDIWALQSMNGVPVKKGASNRELPSIEINGTTNQYFGFSGCNRISGTLFYERGLLRFLSGSSTLMACPDSNIEAEFTKTLQNTIHYNIENLTLTLSNQSGAELVFRKVD